ncbi:MAG: hypothetical protein HKO85_06455 [Xanthomonadales bacterium]|nr:hypothetical protein [Gammaproteobacteria bacterium]MBT8051112.1 hypothetical protein [Gammaproteobacteria bacterium]MBT8057843.1 hypothetical protein [Gammaproteobacteria bacterium]NNJ77709.1 hypothetical protein [Xanthomonadales bacterium]NNL04912.1 hypothetical protein [Xanthomonadales bacterium]
MLRIKTTMQALILITLCSIISLPAVTAGSEEPAAWPVVTDLMMKNLDVDQPDVFMPIGKVYFVNSRDQLTIVIEPDAPYMIASANVHVVQNPKDFDVVLDKKTGKPKVGKFDFKMDYLGDMETRVARHEQVVPFDHFKKVCWGMNKEQCPDFYVIAQAVLQVPGDEEGEWVTVPDDAYATNGGQFDRFDPEGNDYPHIWGHYVSYPKAKPMAGHFVDANVNGLSYATSTQAGITAKITTSTGETGKDGQFWFVTGEQIGFSIGRLFIGDTLANKIISPVELFDGAILGEDDRIANLARILQGLDDDGVIGRGAISIGAPAVACLESALGELGLLPDPPSPDVLFSDDAMVEALIVKTIAACQLVGVELSNISKEEALENLNTGMQAGNLMKRNVSKTPDLANDKAKIEIMPVYVPAQRPDGADTLVMYYDEYGEPIEETGRMFAKPIVVTYLGEVEGTGAFDVFVAISRDDGDSWERRNISRTADKDSLLGYPGKSVKPMLKVKDNMIFVAWTDKYCRGGRPGYAINVCPDTDGDGAPNPCDICRDRHDEDGNIYTECEPDYMGDDGYWQDDLFGVAGPQRSVVYEDILEIGEVPYSCVWTARGVVEEATGDVQWFKPERVTSGRRDAHQLFAGAGQDVAFGIVWQEDPKGLRPGEGHGPGEGWSGANTHGKTDIWFSYITMSDFAEVDVDYPEGGYGEHEDQIDMVDTDETLSGRVKALVPMSLPVKISDNDVCSLENILALGGDGDHDDGEEHDFEHDGLGTHRYCGTVEGIGTALAPGSNRLCAYTIPKENPQGVIHNVCVTQDGRYLDGNTGASRANLFLQPYCKTKDPDNPLKCLVKSAWAIIGYEESKGVGGPPEDEDGCGDELVAITESEDDDHEDRYKPDTGKLVMYHSFKFDEPVPVASGGILNLPETDESGNPVYLTEDPALYQDPDLYPHGPPLLLDWKGDPILAYDNARRVRFVSQPKSKAVKVADGGTGTVLVALYRQGEEGGGKPADIFMRRIALPDNDKGNPYDFKKFGCDRWVPHMDLEPFEAKVTEVCVIGARNVSSVTADPDYLWQNPLDPEKPVKMLRWSWSEDNLADSSAKNPYTDSKAHRGALNGDDLIIGYVWNANWGRNANGKYDLYVRRSFDGGQHWTTNPSGDADNPIEHHVVFRDPVLDENGIPILDPDNGSLLWEDVVVSTSYIPGENEPPRNVSNLRNNRVSVLEPRIVKTPGTIKGTPYPEDKQDISVYQLAYGLETNRDLDTMPDGYPKTPLDIFYSRTVDKGQHYQSVIVTPQSGNGKPEEGWNPLANREAPDEEGAVQMRQTPDGSRMYGIWLEKGLHGTDIMFRRVDYRGADE